MNKKIVGFLLFVLFIVAGCSDYETSVDQMVNSKPMAPTEINRVIKLDVNQGKLFDWRSASNHMLWSAIAHGNHLVSIGFGSHANDFQRSNPTKSREMETQILSIIKQYEGKNSWVSSDAFLNTMDVEITQEATIIALRRNSLIRYIEPADYNYFDYEQPANTTYSSVNSGSGCGYESVALLPQDFTTILPNARAGWTLYHHNVPAAWNVSTGAGITIGIVDTGTSPEQTLLGNSFNDGYSQGRTIQKFGTFVNSIWTWSTTTDGPNDGCGHGTSMAAAAAAPRNDNGMPVGVAYNANLVTYRAAENVVLDGYHEQNGVKNAFTALGNNAAVRIISMSMGHIFSVGKISDGVKYAYGKGKMIFCAGGTSTSFTTFVGVIFPASMPEAIAVTGVKEASTYQKCSSCHTGSKIEFTVAMERTTTGSTSPVVSYYNNETDYVGGSSVATATTAGIAALVWAKNPTWSRQKVLDKMRQAAHFFPTKNAQFGYGNINALLAVQ